MGPTPSGVPVADVAFLQRDRLRDLGDELRDVEDGVVDGRGLFHLSVLSSFDPRAVRKVFRRREHGSDRRGVVERLATYPVLFDPLVVSIREVVDAGVARDNRLGVFLGHVSALFADDDPQLSLEVDSVLRLGERDVSSAPASVFGV